MSTSNTKEYWLDSPGNKDKLFYGIVTLVCLSAIPDIFAMFHLFYDKHPLTEVEEIPVFYGLYSMISFLALMCAAKAVQAFLNRREDYYD